MRQIVAPAESQLNSDVAEKIFYYRAFQKYHLLDLLSLDKDDTFTFPYFSIVGIKCSTMLLRSQ